MGFLLGLRGSMYAVLVVVGLLALAVIARNWSCRHERSPRPPHVRSFTAAVDSVRNGASIVVKTGRRDRRTTEILLADIAAPSEGDALAEISRANLARLAGAQVRVEVSHSRSLGAENDESTESNTAGDLSEDRLFEGRLMVAVVYGQAGANLAIEQLRAGLAGNQGSRPEWIAAEQEARKAHAGIWVGTPAQASPLVWWKLIVAVTIAGGVLVLLYWVVLRPFSKFLR